MWKLAILAAALALTACATTDKAKAEDYDELSTSASVSSYLHNNDPADGYQGGVYMGITLGYDSARMGAADFDLGTEAAVAGVYGGFTRRFAGLVLGIEADYMLSQLEAKAIDNTYLLQAQSNYLASIRARIGIPIGDAILYGTGGLAFTDAEMKVTTAKGGTLKSSDTLTGFAIGAGFEAELTKTMHVRLEAIHYVFPDEKYSFAGTMPFKADQSQTVVRVGLGFKLN